MIYGSMEFAAAKHQASGFSSPVLDSLLGSLHCTRYLCSMSFSHEPVVSWCGDMCEWFYVLSLSGIVVGYCTHFPELSLATSAQLSVTCYRAI